MKTKLDVANYVIDGKQAKDMNELCDKFNVAKVQYDAYKKEKDSLTSDIKSLLKDKDGVNNAGHFTSDKYDVLISITPCKLTIDVAQLQKQNPTLFEELVSQYPKSSNEVITLKSVTPRGNI